jgi:hypothetical protein
MYNDRLNYELLAVEDLEKLHSLPLIPKVNEFNTEGVYENIKEVKKFIIDNIEDHATTEISKLTYSICLKLGAHL